MFVTWPCCSVVGDGGLLSCGGVLDFWRVALSSSCARLRLSGFFVVSVLRGSSGLVGLAYLNGSHRNYNRLMPLASLWRLVLLCLFFWGSSGSVGMAYLNGSHQNYNRLMPLASLWRWILLCLFCGGVFRVGGHGLPIR